MKKGQISAEFIFISILIMVAAFTAFKLYKESAFGLVAEATIKTGVDWELAKAPLENPECGNTFLAGFFRSGVVGMHEYNVSTTDPACTDVLIDDDAKARINGLIMASLGCYYTDRACKGTNFTLY